MSTSQIHNCLLPTDRAMVALHDACSQKFSAVQSNNLVTRNGLDRNYGLDTWLELLTCPCQRIYVSTTLTKKLTATKTLICPGWETLIVPVSQSGTPVYRASPRPMEKGDNEFRLIKIWVQILTSFLLTSSSQPVQPFGGPPDHGCSHIHSMRIN